MIVGRVSIKLMLMGDGELVHFVEAVDADGEDLPLIQALGMLEMAKDSLLNAPPEEEED